MYEFYKQNRDFIIPYVIITVLLVAGAWLVRDYHRNESVYHNTDTAMEDLNYRIERVEQRIAAMQNRLEQTQKTVTGISERVSESRGYAEEIAGGIESAENRLDAAIQRSGRIQNLITEIENANRQGETRAQTAGMAK